MLEKVDWSKNRTYSSGDDDEPMQFYLKSLNNSKSFDLLLGYFSSAAISVLSLGFASFLNSGGTMRVIVNNILSEDDKNAIKLGELGLIDKGLIDLTDIRLLKQKLDAYGVHFFECLAWLIANRKIEIRIIKPKSGKGISHYKDGIFYDGFNNVGFTGSCNFTAYGLLENLESITCFLSWEDVSSKRIVDGLKTKIDEIFNGTAKQVDYLDIDSVTTVIKQEFGNKDINELIIQEQELLKQKASLVASQKTKKMIEEVILKMDLIAREPKFPYIEGPRSYQVTAYERWIGNGSKGVFAMATGTGKTITSLNCLLNEYKNAKSYKAIILVPTTALLHQWKSECTKFNFKNILMVSSKENWNEDLAFFNTANKLIETSFIVIVTYASFVRQKFQSHFNQLPKETLLIADEVHNMGSSNILKVLPLIHLEKRIGLSATPNRQFDELGNLAIGDFFNDTPPYIYSYSMEEAMNNNPPALCKYSYFPHIVYLEDDELMEYDRISKELKQYLDPDNPGKYRDCPRVKILLLDRKRVIHSARNKKPAFKKILKNEFLKRKNLKYTLVYVPEGTEPDYSEIDEYN